MGVHSPWDQRAVAEIERCLARFGDGADAQFVANFTALPEPALMGVVGVCGLMLRKRRWV